jgi:hypothetical protein
MDYFTKWPEAYTVHNWEESTVAEALVTNFCRFGVLQEEPPLLKLLPSNDE